MSHLGEEAAKSTRAGVTAAQQIVSKLVHRGAVQRLVANEEAGKQTEVGAVLTRTVTQHLKYRQLITTVDLTARRTTYATLALHTYNKYTYLLN